MRKKLDPLTLLALPPALATLLGFAASYEPALDPFAHFRPQYAVLLLLAGVGVWLRQRPGQAIGLCTLCLLNLTVMLPQLSPSRTAGAKPTPSQSASSSQNGDSVSSSQQGPPTVRLLLANLQATNRHHDRVRSFLAEADPDLLLLEELTPAWREALSELDERYPYSTIEPRRGHFGIGLWSRLPLEASGIVTLVDERLPSVLTRIDVDGYPLVLLGTHPVPPRNRRMTRLRDRQLAAVARRVRSEEAPVVVLGDLNTTPWSTPFRRLLERGELYDSGRGLQWTWPAGLWPLAIAIDHCLVSDGVRVIDRFTGPDIGSDHYPLVVDLQLATGTG